MNRTELTILLSVTFLLAVGLGWTMRWVFSRINRAGLGMSGGENNDMAARLHAAEEASANAAAEAATQVRDMQNKLRETEAELAAAMDGLREARRQAQEAQGG